MAALGGGTAAITYSSPTLADLNGDNKLDILVGTSNGYVVAVNGANGSVLWSRNVTNGSYGLNQAGCSAPVIRSSPAVGRLRAPGSPAAALAVVIGVGESPLAQSPGGAIAFSASGTFLWSFRTLDAHGALDGCTDGVTASPTVTDVDGDGRDEVVFGSFDQRVYILRDDGSVYPNWPKVFSDTHWASPAVGDLDANGQAEIVLATDEGQQALPCPYPLDWPQNYCGGSIYVVRLNGSVMPGFPYYVWQAIDSSPALGDLNGDGYLDIVFGTGSYYAADTAGSNFDTFKLYAIDRNGVVLSGWPKNLNGVASGSPALGDLDQDGDLDVAMATAQHYCFQGVCGGVRQGARVGWVYGFTGNGTLMWEGPATDTNFNNPGPIQAVTIADYDNDSQTEVIYSVVWEVQIRNGATGAFEIGGNGAPNNKQMGANWSILSAPAVGDINGDGKQEIVAAGATSGGSGGAVYAWKPSDVTGSPAHPWPMFRRNAAHTGSFAAPFMQGGPTAIVLLHPRTSTQTYTYIFPIQNLGDETMTFTTSDNSSKISVQPGSTSIGAFQTKPMTVTLSGLDTYSNGSHLVGTVTMSATYGSGAPAGNSPRSFTVTAIVADTIYKVFLPIVMK
jgi:hypothetical protein